MTGAAAIDPGQFRRAMGAFPTGVTVMSTCDEEGRPHGLTVNSFGSLSLEPSLVQWSIRDGSFGHPIFAAAEMFAVNILAADQEPVSRTFCAPLDRFAAVDWEAGLGGLPLIRGCLAWIECARERTVEAGDHHILIGRVLRTRVWDRSPLLHWKGEYLPIAPHLASAGRAGEGSGPAKVERGPDR